jgi:organic radical activating enzyme
MKKFIEIKRTEDTITFYWKLTDYCNWACSYCSPVLHEGKYYHANRLSSDQLVRAFLDRLESLKGDKKLIVCLTGGEPTTHPLFAEILEKVQSLGGYIDLITNGSRPVAWWKKLPGLPDFNIISLHPEYTDLAKINELALYFDSQKVSLKFNLCADPANWDWVTSVFDQLDPSLHNAVICKILTRHRHEVDPQYVDGQLYNYTKEQMEFIKSKSIYRREERHPGDNGVGYYNDGTSFRLNPYRLTANNNHRFYGWECTAGQTGFMIEPDGKIWAGLCANKPLGFIDSFQPLADPVKCKIPFCKCPADIAINKKKVTLLQGQ